MLYDSVANKEFGRKILATLRAYDFNTAKAMLLKNAQAAPPPPADLPGGGPMPGGPDMGEPKEEERDLGKDGDLTKELPNLLDKAENILADIRVGVDALLDQSGDSLEGLSEVAEQMPVEAALNFKKKLNYQKKVANILVRQLQAAANTLASNVEELSMAKVVLADEDLDPAVHEQAVGLTASAVDATKETLAGCYELMESYCRFASGTAAILKQAQPYNVNLDYLHEGPAHEKALQHKMPEHAPDKETPFQTSEFGKEPGAGYQQHEEDPFTFEFMMADDMDADDLDLDLGDVDDLDLGDIDDLDLGDADDEEKEEEEEEEDTNKGDDNPFAKHPAPHGYRTTQEQHQQEKVPGAGYPQKKQPKDEAEKAREEWLRSVEERGKDSNAKPVMLPDFNQADLERANGDKITGLNAEDLSKMNLAGEPEASIVVEASAQEDEFDLTTKAGRAAYRAKVAARSAAGLSFHPMLGDAHPEGSFQTDLDTKPSGNLGQVETLEDTHKQMMDCATAPPRVRQAAEEIQRLVLAGHIDPESDFDELIANGLDKDAVSYWKQYFGQGDAESSQFAAELIKEHHAKKMAAADRGIISRDRSAISEQVKDIMGLDAKGFESLARFVEQVPLKKQAVFVPQVGVDAHLNMLAPPAPAAPAQQTDLARALEEAFMAPNYKPRGF